MKNIKIYLTLAVLIFITESSVAQQLKYEELKGTTRPSGTFTSYLSKDGAEYKIGDRIKIGVPSSNKTFAFITEGDGILLPITPLLASSSGQETEIKRIQAFGTKRTGFFASIRSKGLIGLSNYSIQLENAISTGEVKSFGMTSDEALTELKKAKDKLELELITQQQYDSIKVILAKFIN